MPSHADAQQRRYEVLNLSTTYAVTPSATEDSADGCLHSTNADQQPPTQTRNTMGEQVLSPFPTAA